MPDTNSASASRGFVVVKHGTCSVPVGAATAWAFELCEGDPIGDADLRRLVACSQAVDRAERRFLRIVGVAGMIGRYRRAHG